MSGRVVHGVANKMDNGRKKTSKKVVRRAVRRAGKKEASYRVDLARDIRETLNLGRTR